MIQLAERQTSSLERPISGFESGMNILGPLDSIFIKRCFKPQVDEKCIPLQYKTTINGADPVIGYNTSKLVALLQLDIYSTAFDIDLNPNNTISIELEKDTQGDDFYLHIEVGSKSCNWQYRVNGNRIASFDGIDLTSRRISNLDFLKSCIADFPL